VLVWVKVERSGDEFNGYYSTDGATWTAMPWNPQTIGMMSSAYIGLTATSHTLAGATQSRDTAVFCFRPVGGGLYSCPSLRL